MRQFFWILVVLFVSVWLGIKISEDPGYALFGYKQWSVEMPLWVAFLSLVLLISLFYFFLRFFDRIETFWLRLKNWLRLRGKFKSYGKTNRGLVELLEGDWKSAEYYLIEGANRSDVPFVNYLAAALAAHEQGRYDKRDLFLQKAQNIMPKAEVAIGLMQAQLQLSQGQLDPALITLKRLHYVAPKHRLVLKLLEKLYIRLTDWDELQKLLPSLRRAKLITYDQQENFESHIYQELLIDKAKKAQNAEELREIWKKASRRVQKNTGLILCYAQKLLSFPQTGNEVEFLLSTLLKKNWNEQAVYLYGLAHSDNAKHQLAMAETWLKQYGYHAVLFLTLARLCMRCQLWGKARSYFEQSLKADARPEAYLGYGQLLEQLGEINIAHENYRLGLTALIPEQALVPVKPFLG